MQNAKLPMIFLRVGLAFVFIYAAVAMSFSPSKYVFYFPDFIRQLSPSDSLLIHSFSVFEILLSAWLLSGIQVFFSAYISALVLIGIVVFNLDEFNILFRNVAIIMGALSLMTLSYREKSR